MFGHAGRSSNREVNVLRTDHLDGRCPFLPSPDGLDEAPLAYAPGEEDVQIAVLGCGYWGSKHVRVLQGLAEVERVIAVDQDVDRLISLQKALPGLTSRTRLEDALDEIDAVVVATPPRSHAPIAMRILEAGKHALVEKPLATSSAEARELVATAESRGLTLMVGHTFEHNPAVWKLRELVESGVVGDVLYVDSARLNLGLYQPDVNVIWDLAPHDISIFNFVLN